MGLGPEVARTPSGVVFGSPGGPRLELAPRAADAPVKLGPLALRPWGALAPRERDALLRAALALLGPRLEASFEPDAIEPDAFEPDAPLGEGSGARESPASSQVTLVDVPSVCERACVFCDVSRTPEGARVPQGSEAEVTRALAAGTGPVLFTGQDALSHPRIVAFIEEAARRGRAPRVIGPPRLGHTRALAPALAAAGLVSFSTSLLGADARSHDERAGRAGAHEALVEASAALRAEGVAVELVAPLVRPLLPELEALALAARALSGAPLTLLVYAPDAPMSDAFDALVPPMDELRRALARVPELSVDAAPLCVLPRGGHEARALVRSDEAARASFAEPCHACEARARCPGVAASVLRAVGSSGLVPLGRAGSKAP